MRIIPSPNYNVRQSAISMLVLHYTGMCEREATLARLCDPQAEVSAHYFITEQGDVVQLVAEQHRAWHAGKAYWRGITDVNSASIGIELENPGHEHGYKPFPEAQIAALVLLMQAIVVRHKITRGNIVGHSDVAPARKQDPGELFPWERLARLRLALPSPTRNLADPLWPDSGFMLALHRFGYSIEEEQAAVVAFQRRFRPSLINGVIDGECRAKLLAVLLPRPMGD
jgi:N-acetylmuramoyl-L-alanine amidase